MNLFKGQTRRGRTPEPTSPYQKAAQAWDERMGAARVQAKNWRLVALGLLALSCLLTIGLMTVASDSRITPYVVEVSTSGEVRAVGSALKDYEPSDAQIAKHIGDFISLIRSLSSDSIVVRQNWLHAYELVTDKAATKLNAYARDSNPFEGVGRTSVTVEITSVVRISEQSFEARWREKKFEGGARKSDTTFTGVFTLVHVPPSTVAALRVNPLGLYIHDFNWSHDYIGEK